MEIADVWEHIWSLQDFFFFVVVAVRPDTGEGFLNSSHFVAVKGGNVKDKSSGFIETKHFMYLMIKDRIFVKPKQPLPGSH